MKSRTSSRNKEVLDEVTRFLESARIDTRDKEWLTEKFKEIETSPDSEKTFRTMLREFGNNLLAVLGTFVGEIRSSVPRVDDKFCHTFVDGTVKCTSTNNIDGRAKRWLGVGDWLSKAISNLLKGVEMLFEPLLHKTVSALKGAFSGVEYSAEKLLIKLSDSIVKPVSGFFSSFFEKAELKLKHLFSDIEQPIEYFFVRKYKEYTNYVKIFFLESQEYMTKLIVSLLKYF